MKIPPLPSPVLRLVLSVVILAGAGVAQTAGTLELVESAPVETTLDRPDLPPTHEVWKRMIDGASERIELAQFYASDHPGSRLRGVVDSLEAAAARGVAVHFLADAKFYRTYPETLDELAARDGIEVRRLDLRPRTGGVLHAKYMIVDRHDVYVGSANFDWRSLEHIQELGLRARSPELGAAFGRLFDEDWQLAAGGAPVPAGAPPARVTLQMSGGPVTVRPVFSPRDLLPCRDCWDLDALVDCIANARQRVSVQLLSYRTVDREGRYYERLETALRTAAARGVAVRMLVADWSKRPGTIEGLQSLQSLPGIEVRMMTIPQASSGFVPYARVVHAKYLVVDGTRGWLGTGNWGPDYFYASRNAGLMFDGAPLGERLQRYFDTNWQSRYATAVVPGATYQAPNVAEPPAAREATHPVAAASGLDAHGRWPAPAELFAVVKVVDGDTVYIQRGGGIQKLRLLSVDTEEKSHGRPQTTGTKPTTLYGNETAVWAEHLFAGLATGDGPPRIGLLFPGGVEENDVYGRLLCHVVLPDGTDYNLRLVREGRSPYFNKYGNSRICHAAFVAAQRAARAARLGIWNPDVNRPADGKGPVIKRPYDRLLPWWQKRADAIDAFRARRAEDPESWVAADDSAGLRAAAERRATVAAFGTIERFFDEADGSLTVLFRSGDRRNALRAIVGRDVRPKLAALDLPATTEEFRQNYLYLRGVVRRGKRGFEIRVTDPGQWQLLE